MSKSHYIIPIFVPHEGCPHDCVFCNQNSITGSKTRVTSIYVKNIIEEYLKTIPKKNRILEVSFFGGTFTAIDIEKQSELLAVAKSYKDTGTIDYIRLSTRPDYINTGILSNLRKFSVDIIELGVQSLDEQVLKSSARGHSVLDVVNATKLIREYGFTLGHQVMLGLPGDTIEKDIKTAELVAELKPDMVRIYPALVLKDTPMERMYLAGTYKPYSLEEAITAAKIVYGIFVANNIQIIRVGLQTTDEINEKGDIIAGPFHPSFRELVEGSIFNDVIRETIMSNFSDNYTVTVNSKDISKLYCYKKKFFNDNKVQLKTSKLKVEQNSSLNRGEIIISSHDFCCKTSINEYLTLKYKEGYLSLL